MAQSSGPNFVLLAGLGVAGYFVWQYLSQPATAATGTGAAASTFLGAGGGTAAAPLIGDQIRSGSTILQIYDGTKWHGLPMTQAEMAAITARQVVIANQTMGPDPNAGAGGGANPPATPPANTDTLYSRLKSAITTQGDTQFTGSGDSLSGTPYHFGFYLNTLLSSPSPSADLVFPGTDLNQPMTAAVYWAGMGPYLAAHGMAGLGALTGLGALMAAGRYQ